MSLRPIIAIHEVYIVKVYLVIIHKSDAASAALSDRPDSTQLHWLASVASAEAHTLVALALTVLVNLYELAWLNEIS